MDYLFLQKSRGRGGALFSVARKILFKKLPFYSEF